MQTIASLAERLDMSAEEAVEKLRYGVERAGAVHQLRLDTPQLIPVLAHLLTQVAESLLHIPLHPVSSLRRGLLYTGGC